MSTTYLYEKDLARTRRRGGRVAARRVLVRLLRTRPGHTQLAFEGDEDIRLHEVPEHAVMSSRSALKEQVVPEQQTLQQRWEELTNQIDDLEYERRKVRDLMIEVERYVVEGAKQKSSK